MYAHMIPPIHPSMHPSINRINYIICTSHQPNPITTILSPNMAFSVPTRGFIDSLASFEDEEFDKLLRGGSGMFEEKRSVPAPQTVNNDPDVEESPGRRSSSKKESKQREKEEKKSSSSKEKKKKDRSATVATTTPASVNAVPPPPPPPPPKAASGASNKGGFLGELQSRAKKMQGIEGDEEEEEERREVVNDSKKKDNNSSDEDTPVASKKSADVSSIEKKTKKLEMYLEELVQSHNSQGIKDVKGLFNDVFLALKPKFESDSLFDGEQVNAILKETMRKCIQKWTAARGENDPVVAHAEEAYKAIDALKTEVRTFAATKVVSKSSGGGGGGGGNNSAEIKALNDRIAELEAEVSRLEKSCDKLKATKRLAKKKVEELEVWQEAVPELRKLLEQTVEEKENLKAQAQDLQRLQKGYKITWVPDAAVTNCLNCDAEFGMMRWKNHCRYCGRVFCYECTARKVEIPDFGFNYDVPVCDHCYNLLRGRQGQR